MGWVKWGKGKRRRVRCPRRIQTAAERLSSCLTEGNWLRGPVICAFPVSKDQ
jgi:hypothetical protein